MKESNFNIIELGIGIPFCGDSTTNKIKFSKKYLYTHDDERWDEKPNRHSFYKELVEMDLHSISHIDSLNHSACNRTGFNGIRYEGDPSTYGNGADAIPIIKGMALMLDFPKFLKTDYLKGDNEITVQLIKDCLHFQNVYIEDYKIILIRTGHVFFWNNKQYEQYFEKEVGLSVEAILWLAEKEIVAIGADNFAVESVPTKENIYSDFYPGHKKFMNEKGIYIMENLNFDTLSNRNINKFYFMAAPIRIKNASAALVNPVAIVI